LIDIDDFPGNIDSDKF